MFCIYPFDTLGMVIGLMHLRWATVGRVQGGGAGSEAREVGYCRVSKDPALTSWTQHSSRVIPDKNPRGEKEQWGHPKSLKLSLCPHLPCSTSFFLRLPQVATLEAIILRQILKAKWSSSNALGKLWSAKVWGWREEFAYFSPPPCRLSTLKCTNSFKDPFSTYSPNPFYSFLTGRYILGKDIWVLPLYLVHFLKICIQFNICGKVNNSKVSKCLNLSSGKF